MMNVICVSAPHWLPFSCSVNSLVAGFSVTMLLSNSPTELPIDIAEPLLIKHTAELFPQSTNDTFRGRHKLIRYRDTEPLESRLWYSHGRLQSKKARSVDTILHNKQKWPVASNCTFALSYHYTVSQKKLCQCYFVNNSVKHWPNLIIFGTQHREETWHKRP